MVLVTIPRLILEYLDQQTKEQQELNPLLKCLIQVLRCCLWCFNECMKFLNEYVYCYVVMSGKPFCKSARSCFGLLVEFADQVILDKIAATILGCIVCITIPATMALLTYLVVADPGVATQVWMPVMMAVVVLAVVTTNGAVRVYDITVTALFVCVFHDKRHFGGLYIPEGLADAMQLGEHPCRGRGSSVSIEMSQ